MVEENVHQELLIQSVYSGISVCLLKSMCINACVMDEYGMNVYSCCMCLNFHMIATLTITCNDHFKYYLAT